MKRCKTWLRLAVVLAVALSFEPAASRAAAPAYPRMAPLEQYRSASAADEIAQARSAAPPSISRDAQILTLGTHGYDVAVTGTNGFVCFVERSWANVFGDPEFWNPKIRSPMCLNAAAARSVLPEYLKRTQGALSGASEAELTDRAKAAIAAKEIIAPDSGAMCYMMSKDGYLNDDAAGPWHPHIMLFLPPTTAEQLGGNVPGSPAIVAEDAVLPVTVLMVPVAKWSDGTPFMAAH